MASPADNANDECSARDARAVAQYRERYRRTLRPPGYRGAWHAVFVLVLGVAAIAGVIAAWPDAFTLQRWWVVAATLVVANVVEYWTHRIPMHRPVRFLRALFERHTRRHHRFFTGARMPFDTAQDLHVVLFPPVLLLFFGVVATTLGLALAALVSREVAALFVVTAIAYYLAYEMLHLVYHLPRTSRVARFAPLRYLSGLHARHHARGRMPAANFNLVFPLCDRVFGTYARGPRHDRARSDAG